MVMLIFTYRGVFNWVVCAHSTHLHSVRFILLNFFATLKGKDFSNEHVTSLGAQFADPDVQCSIRICIHGERGYLWAKI